MILERTFCTFDYNTFQVTTETDEFKLLPFSLITVNSVALL